MNRIFEKMDKPLPTFINTFVRIWLIGFMGIYVTHTYVKLRQMDDKLNTAIFDARIQQIKSSIDHQKQLMEMQYELTMKQIQQLNQKLIEQDRQLKQLTGLRPAGVSNDNVSHSSNGIEWSVFKEKQKEFQDISHRFYGQFE